MYSWLVKEPVFLFPSASRNRQFTAKRLLEPHWKARILRFFRNLGIPLHDIAVRINKLSESEMFAKHSTQFQNLDLDDLLNRTEYQIYFVRYRALSHQAVRFFLFQFSKIFSTNFFHLVYATSKVSLTFFRRYTVKNICNLVN